MKRKFISLSILTATLLTGCNCHKKCDKSTPELTSETHKQALDAKLDAQLETQLATQIDTHKTQVTNPSNESKETQTMTNIKRTDSGLGYEVSTTGSGPKPKVGQTVVVHYTGYLDQNGQPGKQFDSSVSRGTPFETKIGLGYVIPGWDEGLLNMQVGEKCRLFIPADLGYGKRGAGAVIPPNSDLIFDVELLDIK